MISCLEMTKTDFIKKIILIVLGSFIYAIGFNLFIIPSKLLSGGLSGVILIFHYLFNISVGLLFIVFNIPLFILSILKINKKFTILTGIGTAVLSIALIVTTPLTNVLAPVSEAHKLLYCLYGGALTGLGLGIVFSTEGSTGGLDIIIILVKKKYNMDIGMANFVVNLIVIAAGSILFGFKTALYTLIVMYACSLFMDKLMKGFSKQKMLLIVTEKEKEISYAVMNKIKRGLTILYGEGAYTKSKREIMYCVVSPRQLPEVKNLIKEIDRDAFISVIDTSEVQGKGFINLL
ncbi:YitT family protein [Clostridium aestuarii]|uniref:YitT family protein n=1 Tax=Clostridium aestuarii TaxID=338193 RepID=A0ABT4CWP3_9CLOT|nr:YitT family protein [Clostridium aestuarii]MCY6483420.1 YitT family protein [Clostridium aestuarii]